MQVDTADDATTVTLARSETETIFDTQHGLGPSSVEFSSAVPGLGGNNIALSLSEVSAQLSMSRDSRNFISPPVVLQMDPDKLSTYLCHRDVLRKFGANSTQVEFTMRHAVPVAFPTVVMNASVLVTCQPSEAGATKEVECGEAPNVFVTCNGTRSLTQVDCPKQKFIATCRVPGAHDTNSVSSDACEVVAFDEHSTTCRCNLCGMDEDRRRLQLSASSIGTIEVVAMADYVYTDFVNSASSFSEIKTIYDLTDAGLTSIYVMVCMCLMSGLVIAAHMYHTFYKAWHEHLATDEKMRSLDRVAPTGGATLGGADASVGAGAGACGNVRAPNARVRTSERSSSTRKSITAESSRSHMTVLINSYFPGSLSGKVNSAKIERELKTDNTGRIFASEISFAERATCGLKSFTALIVAGFLISIFLDLQYPNDDGVCDTFTEETQCTLAKSIFSSAENKCVWTAGTGNPVDGAAAFDDCSWKKPEFKVLTLVCVLLIVVGCSAPLYAVVDKVFNSVLNAPSVRRVKAEEAESLSMAQFMDTVASVQTDIRRSIVGAMRMITGSVRTGTDDEAKRSQRITPAPLDKTLSAKLRSGKRKQGIQGIAMNLRQLESGRGDSEGSDTDKDDENVLAAVLKRTMVKPAEFSLTSRVFAQAIVDANSGTVLLEQKLQAAENFRWRRQKKRDTAENRNTDINTDVDLGKEWDREFGNSTIGPGGKRSSGSSRRTRAVDPSSTDSDSWYATTKRNYLKLLGAFSTLDVDLGPVSKYVNLLAQADVDALCEHLKLLETDLIEHRSALAKNNVVSAVSARTMEEMIGQPRQMNALEFFDLQWGIGNVDELVVGAKSNMVCRPNTFIAHSVGRAFIQSKKVVLNMKNLPDHEKGVQLMQTFAMDMLGRDTPQAGTYKVKYSSEFRDQFAVASEIKVIVFILVLLVDLYLAFITIMHGAEKGREWQSSWLLVTCTKVVFDIAFKEMLQSVVIKYGIPNLLVDDMKAVRRSLIRGGNRVLKPKPAYHLNRFSATDYTFVSSMVAREFPELVESKLVIMYRDVLPERLTQERYKRQSSFLVSTTPGGNGTGAPLIKMLTLSAVTVALQFGALSEEIQRLMLDVIPAGLLVAASWLLLAISKSASLIVLLLMLLVVTSGPRMWNSIQEWYYLAKEAVFMIIRSGQLTSHEVKSAQEDIRRRRRQMAAHAGVGGSSEKKTINCDIVEVVEDSEDSMYSDEERALRVRMERKARALCEEEERKARELREKAALAARISRDEREQREKMERDAREGGIHLTVEQQAQVELRLEQEEILVKAGLEDTIRRRSMAARENRQRQQLAERLKQKMKSKQHVLTTTRGGSESESDHGQGSGASEEFEEEEEESGGVSGSASASLPKSAISIADTTLGKVLQRNAIHTKELEEVQASKRAFMEIRLKDRLAFRSIAASSSNSSESDSEAAGIVRRQVVQQRRASWVARREEEDLDAAAAADVAASSEESESDKSYSEVTTAVSEMQSQQPPPRQDDVTNAAPNTTSVVNAHANAQVFAGSEQLSGAVKRSSKKFRPKQGGFVSAKGRKSQKKKTKRKRAGCRSKSRQATSDSLDPDETKIISLRSVMHGQDMVDAGAGVQEVVRSWEAMDATAISDAGLVPERMPSTHTSASASASVTPIPSAPASASSSDLSDVDEVARAERKLRVTRKGIAVPSRRIPPSAQQKQKQQQELQSQHTPALMQYESDSTAMGD
jgi:hypothetical protein